MTLLYITNGINGPGGLERVLSIKASLLAEEYGYVTMSVSAMIGDFEGAEYGDFDIPDDTNLGEQILHEIELEELRKCLGELKADDRDFLLECFDIEVGCAKAGGEEDQQKIRHIIKR